MNNEMIVSVPLKTSQVDVVLNALEEKAYNVNALREQIYKEVKDQISVINQDVKLETKEEPLNCHPIFKPNLGEYKSTRTNKGDKHGRHKNKM